MNPPHSVRFGETVVLFKEWDVFLVGVEGGWHEVEERRKQGQVQGGRVTSWGEDEQYLRRGECDESNCRIVRVISGKIGWWWRRRNWWTYILNVSKYRRFLSILSPSSMSGLHITDIINCFFILGWVESHVTAWVPSSAATTSCFRTRWMRVMSGIISFTFSNIFCLLRFIIIAIMHLFSGWLVESAEFYENIIHQEWEEQVEYSGDQEE